jgi:hypothetical protein
MPPCVKSVGISLASATRAFHAFQEERHPLTQRGRHAIPPNHVTQNPWGAVI